MYFKHHYLIILNIKESKDLEKNKLKQRQQSQKNSENQMFFDQPSNSNKRNSPSKNQQIPRITQNNLNINNKNNLNNIKPIGYSHDNQIFSNHGSKSIQFEQSNIDNKQRLQHYSVQNSQIKYDDLFEIQTFQNLQDKFTVDEKNDFHDLNQRLDETVKSENDQWSNGHTFNDFEQFLPCQIENFIIKKLDWDDFVASPDTNSKWLAHTYWSLGYNYDIRMRKMKRSNNIRQQYNLNQKNKYLIKIRYKLIINSWAQLSERSWVKNKWPRLLEHETGHYLIGCLCALEYKKQADKGKYSKNYRMEVQKIFNTIFQNFIKLELRYDVETEHSRNILKQKQWNKYIIDEIKNYQQYFSKETKKGITLANKK